MVLLHDQDCIEAQQLSDAQLETVIYANMRFRVNLPNGMLCFGWLRQGPIDLNSHHA